MVSPGTIAVLKEAIGSDFDKVEVSGMFDAGDRGQLLVLTPLSTEFGSPQSIDQVEFFDLYEIVSHGEEPAPWTDELGLALREAGR